MPLPRLRSTAALIAVLAALMVTFTVAPAQAAFEKSDRQGDNSGGALDLAKVTMKHKNGKLVYTMKTYGDWSPEHLVPRVSHFAIDYKTSKNVRSLMVGMIDGSLDAEICTSNPSATDFNDVFKNCNTRARVSQVDAQTLKIVVPPAAIAKGLGTYRWRAAAMTLPAPAAGYGCPSQACMDSIPQNPADSFRDRF